MLSGIFGGLCLGEDISVPEPPRVENVRVSFSGGDIVGWSEKVIDDDLCRVSKVIAGPARSEFNFHKVAADFSGSGTLAVSVGYSTNADMDEMIEEKHLHSSFRKLESGKEVLITSPRKGQRYAWIILKIKGEVGIRKIKYGCRQVSNGLYGHVPGEFEFAGGKLRYRLMYPKNYDPKKEYPLVISVHGSGGAGTDNRKSMEMITLARYLYTQYYDADGLECFSLVPQIPSKDAIPKPFWPKGSVGGPTRFHPDWPAVNAGGWYARACIELIKQLAGGNDLNIDSDRIYMTGYSYGGKACWEFLKANPGMFAAGASGGGWPVGRAYSIPVGSAMDQLKKEVSIYKDVPVFIFAGEKDRMRFGSAAVNEEILEQGGETRFKIYKGAGHIPAAGKGWRDVENIHWIFSHKR